jgi:hypothetical protein
MCDLEFCNDCWEVVGMSTKSISLRFKVNELYSWVALSCLHVCCFLEQSMIFVEYLKICSRNVYEIFMVITRLLCLSNTNGINFLSVMFGSYIYYKLKFLRCLEFWIVSLMLYFLQL